jgi:hypothetical protein
MTTNPDEEQRAEEFGPKFASGDENKLTPQQQAFEMAQSPQAEARE